MHPIMCPKSLPPACNSLFVAILLKSKDALRPNLGEYVEEKRTRVFDPQWENVGWDLSKRANCLIIWGLTEEVWDLITLFLSSTCFCKDHQNQTGRASGETPIDYRSILKINGFEGHSSMADGLINDDRLEAL
ncbi:hypothetical protein PoB_006575400 [Plakobranchus ocellatus]|uniref:Uncharacterized protein n=1 Tax=Plakobranchus ocellatus TaxID=259542 RepID=A0AAV4D4Y0_9GAST|nr:hypothetical protein PoB_006575400 [Plakobranchus ocellatus]